MPRLLAVIVPSYLLAALAVGLDVPLVVRGPLVAWAALGVPALVVSARLGARTAVERGVLGLAAAAAAVIIVSQALLYTHLWSPPLLLVILGLLCVVGAGRRRLPAA